MQDDEKYKKIKEALNKLHKQKQNSKENSNSQILSDNKTINNQNSNSKNENLKNINLPNSKDNLNNQSYLQNNANKNLNFNKNNNSSNFTNKRDYDENPIIIYDRTELVIKNSIILIYFMIASLIIKNIFFYSPDADLFKTAGCLFLVACKKQFDRIFYKDAVMLFYNDKIIKMVKDQIFVELKPTQLKTIKKSFSYILPNYYPETSYTEIKISIIFLFVCIISLFIVFENRAVLILIFFIFIVSIIISLPLITVIFRNNVDKIYPIIFIQSINGLYCNFMVGKKSEYEELKIYFKEKRNIDLDKVEFKISTFFDVSKKDKKKLDSFIQGRNKNE
ncbi:MULTISPECIES: hypothetical protein [Campylobacter]|uniref:hypothetical protein n=1 Tax=Campylobacter TaxID=194 RepID=UPI0023F25ABE|nr:MULTISPECIES: hypothetical protein [Campylobacter]MCI6641097.1 hypothetical protein [Campylobacter sp.]MDD7422771.1 hypothetical protein [Campylobacter hominis]MDY3117737.1 hypothetical protein [Campylobacter hominis]